MVMTVVMKFASLPQAGNVVTGEMVEELILAGADIIKVGIGPGDGITILSCLVLSFWCLFDF